MNVYIHRYMRTLPLPKDAPRQRANPRKPVRLRVVYERCDSVVWVTCLNRGRRTHQRNPLSVSGSPTADCVVSNESGYLRIISRITMDYIGLESSVNTT